MERCIFNAIRDHVFNLISACWRGFIAERSCATQPTSFQGENPGNEVATQLVEVLDQIGTNMDREGQVDIIYLDRSKA